MRRGAGGRILALDLGARRIGLALSDSLGWTAQPLGVLVRGKLREDLDQLRELVRRHGVGCVVVGRPLLLSGEAGAQARRSEAFAERLGQALPGVQIELWDERWTSAEAERLLRAAGVARGRRRERVDTLAAVLILESFMAARPSRRTASEED